MPGIIAASWKAGQHQRAERLFQQACEYNVRFKGLVCKSQLSGNGFRIARFPNAKSPCPEIYQTEDEALILAGAGWWFDAYALGIENSSLQSLAERYEQKGEKALQSLQGQYLMVAVEPRKGQMIAFGDDLGMFPFYVAESDGIAWCSTSSIALAAALGSQLDTEALKGLFMEGAIRSPLSAFKGIRRVGIGERVLLADGHVQITRVWSPFRKPQKYSKSEEAIEEGLMLLRRSFSQVHQVWPNCISDLTAGLDSRLVVAIIASLGLPIEVTVSGHEKDLDVIIARRIAERFQWHLKHFDEPSDWGLQRWEFFKRGVALAEGELPGSAVDGTIRIKRELSDCFDAAISGGGGALYRDFLWQQEFLKIGKTSDLDLPRVFRYRFFFAGSPQMSLFRRDWRAEYISRQEQIARQIIDLEPEALNTMKLDALALWKSSGHFARYCGAINPLIASPLPLLNRELFEFLVALPWRYRIGGRLERQMITQAHPQLAAMPTWYGGSAEPMRFTRPINYLPYAFGSFKKLVRKLGQVTIGHSIFCDPCERIQDPMVNTDFVSVLDREGFLSIDNLHSAHLYDPSGLRAFLFSARQSDFRQFNQLYAIVTVELLCRMCGLTPTNKEF